MFDQTIQLAAQMQWPAALAIFGIALTISVPVVILGVARRGERKAQIDADKAVRVRTIEAGTVGKTIQARAELD